MAPDLLGSFPRWEGHVVNPDFIPKHKSRERDAYVARIGEWCRANRARRADWGTWLIDWAAAEAERVCRAREAAVVSESAEQVTA
jgi:poly(3-hydroxyalkanoate) synthetase